MKNNGGVMNALFDSILGNTIHVTQHIVKNEFQKWLETVLLVSDNEAERLSNWTVGYYHCSHCNTWKGFAYQLSPMDEVNPQAHNERNDFWRNHAHGDGRVILFERDI